MNPVISSLKAAAATLVIIFSIAEPSPSRYAVAAESDWGTCKCPKPTVGADPCLKCDSKAKCLQEKCTALIKVITDPGTTIATEFSCKHTPSQEQCASCPQKPHKIVVVDCPSTASDVGSADESCKVNKCVYAPLNWSGRWNDPDLVTVDCKGK